MGGIQCNVVHESELTVANLTAQAMQIRPALTEVRHEPRFVTTFIQRDHVNRHGFLLSSDYYTALPISHEPVRNRFKSVNTNGDSGDSGRKNEVLQL